MVKKIISYNVNGLRAALNKDFATWLKNENPDYENKDLGPKAKIWLTKMLGKAVQGSWDIAAGIGANILTNALKSYYGF